MLARRTPFHLPLPTTALLTLLALAACVGNKDKDAKDSADWVDCYKSTLPNVDGDGYPDLTDCEGIPENVLVYVHDCNDDDATIHPGAEEIADGVDQDCDGVIDEGTTAVDDDGDGYSEDAGDTDDADANEIPTNDDDGDGFSPLNGDCNDADATAYPGAVELPDGVDQDCDGVIDEDSSTDDSDGDGYTPLEGDCDDAADSVYPGALEACDEQDNDCDGDTDEDSSVIWSPAYGSPVDLTADVSAGTSSAPAALSISARGTLYVCPGTWYTHISSATELSIIGTDERRTILDGGGVGRVVTSSGTADLYLTKLTITGGDASAATPAGYGGGVFIQYGNATLDEVTLSFNVAVAGGGIGTDSIGDGVMTNVTLYGNEATVYGGAAYLATAMVSGTTFEDNVAGTSAGYGGGLYAGTVEIENSTFTNNSVTGSGGAAWVYGGTITGTTFEGNLATSTGGALTQYNGTLEVSSSAFTDNAASSGGAIHVTASSLMLDAVEMTDNTATHGAGLYAQSTGMDIIGSTINTNSASNFGGAVYGLYSNIDVEDSDVSGNSAGYGGAFFMDTYGGQPSSLTLGVDTVVSNNSATSYGGAILGSLQESQVGPLSITIDGASLNNNQARYGGAIATGWYYGSSPSKAEITCTSGDILDNTSTMGMGGGAYLYFGTGASLVSTGCAWGSDQEVYVVNTTTTYTPSSGGFTCTSVGCI